MTQRLFHVSAVTPLLDALDGGSSWSPPSLTAEGFIHLSFAAQLLGTLQAHFASAGELLLAEIELQAPDELRLEVSRGEQTFPHLYRALRRGEFARHWLLPAAGTNAATKNRGLPDFGSTPVLDDPLGSPGLPDLPSHP